MLPSYRVAAASSEDDSHLASDHSRSAGPRGWQSPRWADERSELVLRFEGRVELQQVQLLSHQFKIASRVELFIGSSVGRRAGAAGPAYLRPTSPRPATSRSPTSTSGRTSRRATQDGVRAAGDAGHAPATRPPQVPRQRAQPVQPGRRAGGARRRQRPRRHRRHARPRNELPRAADGGAQVVGHPRRARRRRRRRPVVDAARRAARRRVRRDARRARAGEAARGGERGVRRGSAQGADGRARTLGAELTALERQKMLAVAREDYDSCRN